jgi:hypothetical protein
LTILIQDGNPVVNSSLAPPTAQAHSSGMTIPDLATRADLEGTRHSLTWRIAVIVATADAALYLLLRSI